MTIRRTESLGLRNFLEGRESLPDRRKTNRVRRIGRRDGATDRVNVVRVANATGRVCVREWAHIESICAGALQSAQEAGFLGVDGVHTLQAEDLVDRNDVVVDVLHAAIR